MRVFRRMDKLRRPNDGLSRPPVRWGISVRLAGNFVLHRAGFVSLTGWRDGVSLRWPWFDRHLARGTGFPQEVSNGCTQAILITVLGSDLESCSLDYHRSYRRLKSGASSAQLRSPAHLLASVLVSHTRRNPADLLAAQATWRTVAR